MNNITPIKLNLFGSFIPFFCGVAWRIKRIHKWFYFPLFGQYGQIAPAVADTRWFRINRLKIAPCEYQTELNSLIQVFANGKILLLNKGGKMRAKTFFSSDRGIKSSTWNNHLIDRYYFIFAGFYFFFFSFCSQGKCAREIANPKFESSQLN